MPVGQFKSVYAVSSEDSAHPATNLLKIQPGKKWKCKEPGEKSAFVILQLDCPQKIIGIDVGNEHSSFVMVSVGKLSYSKDEFKEILITSSLMTPIESKNSTATNRVRCFSANALVESVAKEKWELVMALVTQPFNRHVQYGLSFLTVHVEEDDNSSSIPSPTSGSSAKTENTSLMSSFKLGRDSSDSDNENGTSLFKRWKQSRKEPLSAAAIRAASQPSSLLKNSEALKPSTLDLHSSKITKEGKEKRTIRDRNRENLLFGEEDDVRNERLEKKIFEDKERVRKERELYESKQKKKTLQPTAKPNETNKESKKVEVDPAKDKSKVTSQHKHNNSTTKNNSKESEANIAHSSRKRQSSPTFETPAKTIKKLKQEEKPIEYKPFNQLLKGVVLVISGIQNPDRANLRQKAIQLGAQYKPDWDNSCTHLICAFKNTPKYNQVKNKGKIVTRHWIEKCHSRKKRLPWRRFALDDKEGDKPESEDEIHDISLKPPPSESDTEEPKDLKEAENIAVTNPEETAQRRNSLDEIMMHYDNDSESNNMMLSGSDTDDEIEKAKTKPKKTIFQESTDEDENIRKPIKNGTKPELFDGLKFYINNNLSTPDIQRIKNNIEEFRGKVIDNAPCADYIISKEKSAEISELNGEVVSPLWIFECHEMECRMPTRRYLV